MTDPLASAVSPISVGEADDMRQRAAEELRQTIAVYDEAIRSLRASREWLRRQLLSEMQYGGQ